VFADRERREGGLRVANVACTVQAVEAFAQPVRVEDATGIYEHVGLREDLVAAAAAELDGRAAVDRQASSGRTQGVGRRSACFCKDRDACVRRNYQVAIVGHTAEGQRVVADLDHRA